MTKAPPLGTKVIHATRPGVWVTVWLNPKAPSVAVRPADYPASGIGVVEVLLSDLSVAP